MRRTYKSSPPRNVSPANQQPRSLREAEREYLTSLKTAQDRTKFARESFEALDRSRLREVLGPDQRGICVYCERRLPDGQTVATVPPVEHWRPLALNPELALHWPNLYLSCPTPGTCDDAKGGRRLAWDETDPDLPWPPGTPYEDWIGFTLGGEAYVRTDHPIDACHRRALELAIEDRDDGVRRRRTILNLNDPALVAERKAQIDRQKTRMERLFPARHASQDERDALAREMLAQDPYPEFVSIRVAYLRRHLGKHR